jgi:hypothetical protein
VGGAVCLLVNFNETAFVTVVGCNGATVALDFGLDPSKANGLIIARKSLGSTVGTCVSRCVHDVRCTWASRLLRCYYQI